MDRGCVKKKVSTFSTVGFLQQWQQGERGQRLSVLRRMNTTLTWPLWISPGRRTMRKSAWIRTTHCKHQKNLRLREKKQSRREDSRLQHSRHAKKSRKTFWHIYLPDRGVDPVWGRGERALRIFAVRRRESMLCRPCQLITSSWVHLDKRNHRVCSRCWQWNLMSHEWRLVGIAEIGVQIRSGAIDSRSQASCSRIDACSWIRDGGAALVKWHHWSHGAWNTKTSQSDEECVGREKEIWSTFETSHPGVSGGTPGEIDVEVSSWSWRTHGLRIACW